LISVALAILFFIGSIVYDQVKSDDAIKNEMRNLQKEIADSLSIQNKRLREIDEKLKPSYDSANTAVVPAEGI